MQAKGAGLKVKLSAWLFGIFLIQPLRIPAPCALPMARMRITERRVPKSNLANIFELSAMHSHTGVTSNDLLLMEGAGNCPGQVVTQS